MCVAESGWRDVPDHAAILHAIDRLAKRNRLTLEQAINKHVSEFKYGWRKHRAWIPKLTSACEKPDGFRRTWGGAHQHLCFRLVATIRQHRAGKLRDPARGRPDQWRARGKATRRARRLYYQVGVPGSVHAFFDSSRHPDGKRRR